MMDNRNFSDATSFFSDKMRKISKRGVYQPFYGVTVLSKVLDKNIHFVEEYLWRSGISSKFSPLPYKSYHMTVFDLVVPENAQEEQLFQNFLDQNSKILNDISRECQTINAFEAKLKKIYWTNGTIGVELEPSIESEAREKISKKSGIRNKKYVFHMTLAYRFNEGAPTTDELKGLAKVLKKVFPFGKATFEKPKVYKFNSMREFISYK